MVGLTVAKGRNAWNGAGFTGTFSAPTGPAKAIVTSQSQPAGACLPADATEDVVRFAFNSTLGIGGLIDWATPAGLPKHHQDFGLTLAHYGVPLGPYLVVPVFGPEGELIAVLDVDSDQLDAFDEEDKRGLEKILKLFA